MRRSELKVALLYDYFTTAFFCFESQPTRHLANKSDEIYAAEYRKAIVSAVGLATFPPAAGIDENEAPFIASERMEP